jgi:hypothetical protein
MLRAASFENKMGQITDYLLGMKRDICFSHLHIERQDNKIANAYLWKTVFAQLLLEEGTYF